MRTDSGQSSLNLVTDPKRKKKEKRRRQQQQQRHEKKDESEEQDAEGKGANRLESQVREDYSPKKKNKTKKDRNAATTIPDNDAVGSFDFRSGRAESTVIECGMSGGSNETEVKKKKRKDAVGCDLETVGEISNDNGKAKERRKRKEKGGDDKGRLKDEESRLGEVAKEDGEAEAVNDENFSSGDPGKKKKKRTMEDDADAEVWSKKERNGDWGDDVGKLNRRKKENATDAGDESRRSKKKRRFEDICDGKNDNEDAERSKKGGNGDIADDACESQETMKRDDEDDLDNGVSSKKRGKIDAKDDIDSTVRSKGKRKKRKDDSNTDVVDARSRKTTRKGHVEGDVNGILSKSKKEVGMKNVDGRAKQKRERVAGDSENDHASKESRKVRFSDEVEVFPLPKGGKDPSKADEENLVQGKRFTEEEDQLVKDAVLNFIKVHDLGENGVDILMNCRRRPDLKGCWQEIGALLPWRPYKAVYYRAHILFEGDGKRKWDSEEYELLRRHHEKHGSDWKKLAVQLGKHRFHIKDAWRRIKLPNIKAGCWSQDEYQTLFDLVNKDLCIRAHTEKVDKHGMLRDNIGWEAISESLSTRTNVTCCIKWYAQLASPMVSEGLWNNSDDYRLLEVLVELDASCLEDVDWDNLLEHRSGDLCLRRWKEMSKHIGGYKEKPFTEQVEVLASRYNPDMLEAAEAYESKKKC